MRIGKFLVGLILGCSIAVNAAAQEIVVKVAPPHAIVETRGHAPGPNYAWISGYHR